MSGARTRIRPGDLIADRYRIESALGAGGMGIVFAATDLKSGAPVAIKILSAHLSDTATGHARFLREARASATIESAHAIRVLDTSTHDGTPFMVMERLEGFDLARVIASRGALPVPMAALALRQACEGISAAHEASLVHRDIEPSNLFRCPRRRWGGARRGARLRHLEGDARIRRHHGADGHDRGLRLASLHVAGANPKRQPRAPDGFDWGAVLGPLTSDPDAVVAKKATQAKAAMGF